MKYALIVCPHCLKIRIIQQEKTKTRCQFCGKVSKLKELQFFKSSDDLGELIEWKAAFCAEMEGKSSEFAQELLHELKVDTIKSEEKKTHKASSEKDTVLEVACELEKHYGKDGFTFGEFSILLREKKTGMNAKKWVEVLQREAIVYKGKDGKYRAV